MVFAQRGCLSSNPFRRKPLLLAISASFGTHRSRKHAGNVVTRIILPLHVGRNGVLIVSGPAIARSSVTCQRSAACASRTATRSPPVCLSTIARTSPVQSPQKNLILVLHKVESWLPTQEKQRRKVAALNAKKGAYTRRKRKRKSKRRRKGRREKERSGRNEKREIRIGRRRNEEKKNVRSAKNAREGSTTNTRREDTRMMMATGEKRGSIASGTAIAIARRDWSSYRDRESNESESECEGWTRVSYRRDKGKSKSY